MSDYISNIKKFVKESFSRIVRNEIMIHHYNNLAINCTNSGLSTAIDNNPECIISLTTYSKRIHDVHITIESIMQQTYKANKIILWLDENEYTNKNLPLIIKKQIERGLTVKYYKNIKSYKKLIPTLLEYPNDIIITIDDDIIYPNYFIERMIIEYQKSPQYIYYYAGRRIKINKPYNKWTYIHSNIPEMNVLPIGFAGILYPPNSFHEDIYNEKAFMSICENADDIWFRSMSILKNKFCKQVSPFINVFDEFITIEKSQDIALANNNFRKAENDIQIKRVFEKYNIYSLLK